MPVDKEDRPRIFEIEAFLDGEDNYCLMDTIICSFKSQAIKFSEAIKALVEAERKRKEPGK